MAEVSQPVSRTASSNSASSSSSSLTSLPGGPDKELVAPHDFKLKHFPTPTWCKFCTKFIWGLGKQGYQCKACKDYPVHTKCLNLAPPNCPKQIVNDPNSKKNIARAEIPSMGDLVRALQQPGGPEVKDRKWHLKMYNQCIVGSEVVDWMLQHLPVRDREEAVTLGQQLIDRGYIQHVVDHKKKFKDGEYFYSYTNASVEPEEAAAAGETTEEVTEDDFKIIQVAGKGGFAKVFRVMHKKSGKVYAMKVMAKSKISGERQLQCLIAEKNIMLNDNPFLVHLHYSFQTHDKLFFVMDYIPGGDLAHHLEKNGPFNDKEVRFIAAEIVLGLEHLHSCGIVYRDLKLENVLLDRDGHVCLTDFGLSKELESISATTKTVCGTPTYLAPEVLLGQPYGNLIDWWSLGVVIFELFTSRNPFDAYEFDAVLQNILHAPIRVPEAVPPSGKDLIEKLLQRNPQKRLCSGATGSAEIQNHEFFKSIDWKQLMVKKIKPPYKPKINEANNVGLDMEGTEVEEGKHQPRDLENFEYAKKNDFI